MIFVKRLESLHGLARLVVKTEVFSLALGNKRISILVYVEPEGIHVDTCFEFVQNGDQDWVEPPVDAVFVLRKDLFGVEIRETFSAGSPRKGILMGINKS